MIINLTIEGQARKQINVQPTATPRQVLESEGVDVTLYQTWLTGMPIANPQIGYEKLDYTFEDFGIVGNVFLTAMTRKDGNQ